MKVLAFFVFQVLFITTANAHNLAPKQRSGDTSNITSAIKTPLDILINKLENKWQFVETNDMLDIGYTKDMYAIAAYKDNAIAPLLNLIDTTKNLDAKVGAMYTIHLIGIDHTKSGWMDEKFINKKARNALLHLLDDNDIGLTAMCLLVRDPWQSDVPVLVKKIQDSPSAWYIVSGLYQYRLPGYPLNGEIPDNIKNLPYSLAYINKFKSEETPDSQLLSAIYSIKIANDPFIEVDDRLFNYRKLWGNDESDLDGIYDSHKNTIAKLMGEITSGMPGTVGTIVNYFVKDGKLYLCSPQKSREVLLNWWNDKPVSYKQRFTANAKEYYDN